MKKVLTLTVVMAFVMMLGFGIQSASADSVLFPYFASGGGDLTFVQIINTKSPTVSSSGTLVLQPAGAAGKDASIHSNYPNDNNGSNTSLFTNSGGSMHGMIEFDISAIPAGATINSATLEIREYSNCSWNQNNIEVHVNLGPWTEFSVTWNTAPAYGPSLGTNSGETPGCDWLIFNVAGIVQDWVDGTSTNYGLRITGPSSGNPIKMARSSDYSTASLRPILRIDYSVSSASESETLHYTYVYNTDTEICQHYDDDGDTSENDILLYEVTDALAPGASGQLLPGDTTSTSPALTVSPAWGYLVVDNDMFGTPDDEGNIQGQSIQINTDDMTAYILNGINDPGEYDENEFDDNVDDDHWLSFQPEDFASTVWYFFQIDGDDIADSDPDTYSIDSCSDLDECFVEIGNDAGGVFDNNESLKSGTPRIYPGCQYEEEASLARTGIPGWQSSDFFYTLDDLLTGAQYNAVKNTGGWFDIYWDNDGYVYKIVSSDAFGATLTGMVYEPQEDYNYSYTK